MTLYAGKLILKPEAVARLRVTDPYSVHRVVMDLYEAGRSEDQQGGSLSSGIQWVDAGEHVYGREIRLLTAMPPRQLDLASDLQLESRPIPAQFFDQQRYQFSLVANPCREQNNRRVGARGIEEALAWFERKSQLCGFTARVDSVDQLGCVVFRKDSRDIAVATARFCGELQVTDRNDFMQAVQKGIGRGRAWGFGMLQLRLFSC